MKILSTQSIANKLIAIILITSGVSLLTGYILIAVYDIFSYRAELSEEAEMIARMTGEYCASALIFEDRIEANRILENLEQVPYINTACVIDNTGKAFACYSRIDNFSVDNVNISGRSLEESILNVNQPIQYQDINYGTLYLRLSSRGLTRKIVTYLVIISVLFVLLLALSYIIALRFQGFISNPILDLSQTAKKITDTADYSIRVNQSFDDEIGTLSNAFNTMLLQLQKRQTERYQVENELKKSESRLRTIIEQSTDPMFILKDGHFVFINPKIEEYFGYTSEEITSEDFDITTIIAPESRKNFESILIDSDGRSFAKRFDFKGVSKFGYEYDFEVNLSLIDWEGGTAYLGTLRDITQRKKIEQALKYRVDLENIITSISANFISLQQEPFDEQVSRALSDIAIFSGVDHSYLYIYDHKTEHFLKSHEWHFERKSAEKTRFADFHVDFLPWFSKKLFGFKIIHIPNSDNLTEDAENEKSFLQKNNVKSVICVPMINDNTLMGFIGFGTVRNVKTWVEEDITLLRMVAEILVFAIIRKRSDEILSNEKERLAVTLRSIGDGVITTDINGRIAMMNKEAENLTGWTLDEASGVVLEKVYQVYDEKSRTPLTNLIQNILDKGFISAIETISSLLVSKDGAEKIISHSGAPIIDKTSNIIGLVIVFRDITEETKMKEELINAQKLESVGILAGGIAHDFNNILTAILGNISLGKMEVPEESDIYEILSHAEMAVTQAQSLTQQLLTFSKGGAPIMKITTIADILLETVSFCLRGSSIKSVFSIADDLHPVEIDEGQISQVINNLVINAIQSMPDGGILEIAAENDSINSPMHTYGKNAVNPGFTIKPGNYVKISIIDSGTGIPKEISKRIFDPYFTTKENGSGLGLSVVYSVINRHNGFVEVESTGNSGSTFNVWLPASEKTVDLKQKKKNNILVKQSGRILLMDDEENIRIIGRRMLNFIGYDVVCTEDGNRTIETYRESMSEGKPFDAVIMDLTIPGGLGGKECIQELLKINPDVKAIVSSGYSNDPVMAEFRKYGFKGVIIKPYKIEELSDILVSVISDA